MFDKNRGNEPAKCSYLPRLLSSLLNGVRRSAASSSSSGVSAFSAGTAYLLIFGRGIRAGTGSGRLDGGTGIS